MTIEVGPVTMVKIDMETVREHVRAQAFVHRLFFDAYLRRLNGISEDADPGDEAAFPPEYVEHPVGSGNIVRLCRHIVFNTIIKFSVE